MSLHIAKPYLNLTDFRRCKFCWYFTPAKNLPSHGGCKLHQSMVAIDYKCNQWLDPTGEIKVDADDRGYEAPRNKVIK